jgi:gas vesicle protein
VKFLLGLLVGFGLGVAAGLLMAPQAGEDTRAQLNEQGVMLRDRSANLTEQVRNRATDALAQGRELYQRTRNELAEQYSKARSNES